MAALPKRLPALLAGTLLAAALGGCDSAGPPYDFSDDPAAVRLVTADLVRFWDACDQAAAHFGEAAQVEAFRA